MTVQQMGKAVDHVADRGWGLTPGCVSPPPTGLPGRRPFARPLPRTWSSAWSWPPSPRPLGCCPAALTWPASQPTTFE